MKGTGGWPSFRLQESFFDLESRLGKPVHRLRASSNRLDSGNSRSADWGKLAKRTQPRAFL